MFFLRIFIVMKKYILVLGTFVLFALVLFQCKPEPPVVENEFCMPADWLPMDTDYVYESYIPKSLTYRKATYISENNEQRTFDAGYEYENIFVYENTCCQDFPPGAMTQKNESISCENNKRYKNDVHKVLLSFRFWTTNRYNFIADYYYEDLDTSYKQGSNYLDYSTRAIFEKEFGHDADYKPTNPNAVIDFFKNTDTIYMKNLDDKQTKAVLVKGKGLIWFIDHKGVKWTLRE